VFDEANAVVEGSIISSGVGACEGEQRASFYIVRLKRVIVGDISISDVRVCGIGLTPILLGQRYIFAGKISQRDGIVFLPDSVFLVFREDEYYRLISFDSPIVKSDRGKAYAVGIRDDAVNGILQEMEGEINPRP